MMDTLIIIGAGGHGRVIADAATAMGCSNILFYDDAYPDTRYTGSWKIHGTSQDLLHTPSNLPIVIGIGNNLIRMEKAKQFKNAGFNFTSIIHPRAIVSPSAKINVGTVVFAGAVINSCATINEHCIINTNATIEHDCYLDTAVHVSPNAALGGGTKVGKLSWVGIGASVKQCTLIGESVIIGAGAAVVKDLPSHSTAIGVPARVISNSD